MLKPFCPVGAITDEFSPNLEKAVSSMAEIGMTFAELRMVSLADEKAKNILELTDVELDRAITIVRAKGLDIRSIATPIFKCVLPGISTIDPRWAQDIFGLPYTITDQKRLKDRALVVAKRTGARFIRVFSYVRTVEPGECHLYVRESLREFADAAKPLGLTIALENEHSCSVATATESARLLADLDHPNLGLVWDPANALVAGEEPFPLGYGKLPANRIVHVHAKDCIPEGDKPNWCVLGGGQVDWIGQIRALKNGGYNGGISLETHWPGPPSASAEESKWLASVVCGHVLQVLAGLD